MSTDENRSNENTTNSDLSAKLANLRFEYLLAELDESIVEADPFLQFQKWMNEALLADVMTPTAMNLATARANGQPSCRVVLLKGLEHNGFVFYTNYTSDKGNALKENPKACLNFFWSELQRQVRIVGAVKKVNEEESKTYFASRPRDSQIGAWASLQSTVIESRKELEDKVYELTKKYEGKDVPKPEDWGGYVLMPEIIEFWQGRESRLHDRIVYTKAETDWRIARFAP